MTYPPKVELPKVQKLPRQQQPKGKKPVARTIAGLAGLVFIVISMLGLTQALQSSSGKSPFMALALLLPAAVLLRYAWTGVIKMN